MKAKLNNRAPANRLPVAGSRIYTDCLPAVSYDWLACGVTEECKHGKNVIYDWRLVFLFFRNWKLDLQNYNIV